ncbi:hypothetical protein AB0I35_13770 [Nocardia sp. NPDC050378]|uniref:alpha/beta hydrolase family protein n=1 Tax=Nocardia sp. NPDC050378 TaxID=3155400 RepID=UPI0033DA274B
MAEPVPSPIHGIGVTTLHLVDAERHDPWEPSARRELVVTVHYPAARADSYPPADRILPGLAPARARLGAPTDAATASLPVLLYSPAMSLPAGASSMLAEELADQGYVVVSVGDTHGAFPGTFFPDGHVELYDPRNATSPAADVMRISSEARAGDIEFVLDELTAMQRDRGEQLPDGVAAAMDLDRVGMYGHSLGGTMTLYADERIRAGVDLDGYAEPADLDPDLTVAPDRPLLFLFGDWSDSGVRRNSVDLMSAGRTGWTRELLLTGAGHWTFSDLKGLPAHVANTPALSSLLGAIDPQRAHTVVATYVSAMFDRFLRNRPTPILDAPDPGFPEVEFVR